MAVPTDKFDSLQKLLDSLVPTDGKPIGNVSLRNHLFQRAEKEQGIKLEPADYWVIREPFLAKGAFEKERGKGGSIRRVIAQQTPTPDLIKEAEEEKRREIDLYDPLMDTIIKMYAPDYDIKEFVCEKTALQGRRNTGGKWTRPDITLIAVRKFEFVPGNFLEVITFEVKPLGFFGVDGAFEAAAHSAFAHRSCLAVQVEKDFEPGPDFDRLASECRRFNVTLISFVDPKDYDTFDTIYDADLGNPAPAMVDAFIRKQISPQSQDALRKFLES